MSLQTGLLLLGYVVLFTGSSAALLWWHRRQRRRRLPFGENVKLLRTPGETQLQLARKLDEEGPLWLVLAAVGPAAVGLFLLWLTSRLPSMLQLGGLVVAGAGFAITFVLAARWFAGRTREYQNRYLGYFGERVVGEQLEPLKAQGWRVYHDVPAENNGTAFNLDHVVVGPGGVIAIETKTRRKGSARPGFKDHEVFFDGRDLVWPWGEDNHGLEQAERNAQWLADWIRAETGERIPVSPVLVLPGWWVEHKPAQETRRCQVLNPKALAAWLAQERPVLDARQVGAIAARLDARCRDVGY